MSFTSFLQDDPLYTREWLMRTAITVADELGMPDKRGAAVVVGMAISTEVGVEDNDNDHKRRFWCPSNHADEESFNYPHDSISDDGRSVGVLQQQKSRAGDLWWGPTSSEMNPHSAMTMFMQRLKAHGYNASNANAAGVSAQSIQGSGFPDRYATNWVDINALYDSVKGSVPPAEPVKVALSPYPEHNIIDGNCSSSRNGRKPRLIVLHTEEGNMLGKALDQWMDENQVSYHYAIDIPTGEAWDLVDTDRSSWSVLDANPFCINYVFAGSFAKWGRAEWLAHPEALKQTAFLVAQDCKKYGIPPQIIVGTGPNGYSKLATTNGITDHLGITKGLGIGNHSDVGMGFPWDVFNTLLQQYFSGIEDDDMFTDADRDMLKRVHFELTNPWNSASIYAGPNEKPAAGNTLVGVALAIDGMSHAVQVEDQARKGDDDSIQRIIRTAAGKGLYGNDPRAVERAKAALETLSPTIGAEAKADLTTAAKAVA